MKSLRILFLLLIFPLLAFASDGLVKGHVYDSKKQPLIGATVTWESDKTGVVTDENGFFQISANGAKDHMLVITYVGFNSKVVHVHHDGKEITVILDENVELNEVVIAKRVAGTIKSRVDVLNSEKITTKELQRAACCNLAESFETNPSVDVSFSDAVTGAKQIQLLGLSGTYVQMLTENYPNFRGPASIYGMDYIPGPWMESIQVSKGAASVKNGYESLTGQVNIEYKKPRDADPLSLNVFASDANRYEGNADAAFILNDHVATGLFLHYSNENGTHDDNNDSFLDGPKKHQFNAMNRWDFNSGNYMSRIGVRYLQDYRTSGQTHHTLNDASLNTDPYEIFVNTNRIEFFTKNSYMLNPEKGTNVAAIFTGSYHDQQAKYDVTKYNIYETNLYASAMFETNFSPQHSLSTGLSMNWDQFKQRMTPIDLNAGLPSNETTTGAYAQYTFNKDDKFVALAGLRLDYSTLHNFFVTPRLHLKYTPNSWLSLRASAGKGYRTVFVMPENSFYLASSRDFEIARDLKQEEAWNYGASVGFHVPIANENLELSAEWYYTDFENQVVIDLEDSKKVRFYNLDGNSYSNNLQFQASYPLFRGFNLLAAYRWIDTRVTYDGIKMRKPLTSKYKAMVTASYETKMRKWQFDFTTQFNGGGRMPTPNAANPLWDKNFGSYVVMNAQITKNFRDWSIYAGAENIGDYTQKKSIIQSENPYGDNFDATMVWGPTMGRKFYVGLRYTIGK